MLNVTGLTQPLNQHKHSGCWHSSRHMGRGHAVPSFCISADAFTVIHPYYKWHQNKSWTYRFQAGASSSTVLVFTISEQALLPPDKNPPGSCGPINQLWPRSVPLIGRGEDLQRKGFLSGQSAACFVCACAAAACGKYWFCFICRLNLQRCCSLRSCLVFDHSTDQVLSVVWSDAVDLKVDYLFFNGLLLKIRWSYKLESGWDWDAGASRNLFLFANSFTAHATEMVVF